MEKNSNSNQRSKHDSSINDVSDIPQTATRTRQKRGSTSQTPVSSSVGYTEDSNQCNGLSTSASQTPKSHSASVLSSSEPLASGRQRRSARLSQMEFQQLLNTPEKRKKKNDIQKTPGKVKRKGKLDHLTEGNESETSVSNKRTPGKSKKSTSSETSVKNDKGDEEGEPVEKRAKRASRRSKLNELPQQEVSDREKQADNEGEIGLPSSKSTKKQRSKPSELPLPENNRAEEIKADNQDEIDASISNSNKKHKSKLNESPTQGSSEEHKQADNEVETSNNSGVLTYKSSKKLRSKLNELPVEKGNDEEKQSDNEGEIDIPTFKSNKKRKSKSNELLVQELSSEEEKQVYNETEMDESVPTYKLSENNASNRQIVCDTPSPVSDHQKTENMTITLKQEETPKLSKRKKFSLSSSLENHEIYEEVEMQTATSLKIPNSDERIHNEVQNKRGYVDATVHNDLSNPKTSTSSHNTEGVGGSQQIVYNRGNDPKRLVDTLYSETQNSKLQSGKSETPQASLKGEKVSKESIFRKTSSLSPSKEDLVQEYNRSISEKISLLKPKAFVGRSSTGFRKAVVDHCDGSGQDVDSDAESRRAIMESAQRRIEQNLSTSESDSRIFRGMHAPMAHSSKNDSSESDSAPEAVSFINARQEAMETIKSAAEHVKREKQRVKERRRARLEMLKQQKEEKLIRLKEKMASQEDASCSSSEESGYEEEIRNARQKLKKKKTKTKAQRTEKENLDDAVGNAAPKPPSGAASDDSSEEDCIAAKEAASLGSLKRVQTEMFQSAIDAVSAKMQKVGSSSSYRALQEDKLKKKRNKGGRIEEPDKKDRGFKSLTSLDFIPLSTEGATKFMVVPLDKAMRAPKSLAEDAADFRQNMLYGSRIKRESSKIISAYQQKLIASSKNFHVRK